MQNINWQVWGYTLAKAQQLNHPPITPPSSSSPSPSSSSQHHASGLRGYQAWMLPPATPSQTAADKLAVQVFINITHFYHCQSRLKKKKKKKEGGENLSQCSSSLLASLHQLFAPLLFWATHSLVIVRPCFYQAATSQVLTKVFIL